MSTITPQISKMATIASLKRLPAVTLSALLLDQAADKDPSIAVIDVRDNGKLHPSILGTQKKLTPPGPLQTTLVATSAAPTTSPPVPLTTPCPASYADSQRPKLSSSTARSRSSAGPAPPSSTCGSASDSSDPRRSGRQ